MTLPSFLDLGIYTDEVLQRYRGKNRLEVPPHVFSIAEGAYYNMNAYKENQCVIISGESGAGKTEAAKRIMQYIAEVSGGQDSGIQEIKDMVLATNPLLESFGCAKTLRNNNSSPTSFSTMFFKKAYLSFAALVSLSGAMADSPFGPASTAGLTIDDLQMNYYCGLGPRVQNQAYACFLFSGDIKKSMYEPFNTHGYMDSLGSRRLNDAQ